MTAVVQNSEQDIALAAKEWADYMETLAPLGERLAKLTPDMADPQMRQELYQQIYSMISKAYVSLVYMDTQNPDWMSHNHMTWNWLVPNPDNVYLTTPVDDNGVYRLSGFVGNIHYVTLHLGGGKHTLFGFGKHGPAICSYRLDDGSIEANADGSFELIVSPTRPEGYTGNWRKLGEGTTYLMLRQSSYDWVNEVDWRVAIERLDKPAARPYPSASEIEKRLKMIGPAVQAWTKDWLGFYLNGPDSLVNDIRVESKDYTSGLATQAYWDGVFDIEADEALILETELPKECGYWNIQLGDLLWRSIDYINRQTSLNGYQARLDQDGMFRCVISAKDPGVPNWLDVSDHKKGYIFGRWASCSSYPTPTIKKIKVADVRKHLPAGTPVVTAEEREKSIRERMRATQLRKRW